MTTDFHCPLCDRGYTSHLAAAECEDACTIEDLDRKSGRTFRFNRDAGGIYPSSD